MGRAHKKGVFFLPSFFFAPRVSKKKRYCGVSFCQEFSATFLKKGSTKNFTMGKVLVDIARSPIERTMFAHSHFKRTMFALHPRVKVLVKLFQKLAGLGRAHKKGAFFLPSFFFAPHVPKKKRYCGVSLYQKLRSLFEKSSAKTLQRVKF